MTSVWVGHEHQYREQPSTCLDLTGNSTVAYMLHHVGLDILA